MRINQARRLLGQQLRFYPQASLVNLPIRNYDMKKLHIYEKGGRTAISGINATMFGGTSVLGMLMGSMMTKMGSTVVYPYRNQGTIWDSHFKEVKPTADLGHKAYVKLMDFTNIDEIKHVVILITREDPYVFPAVDRKAGQIEHETIVSITTRPI